MILGSHPSALVAREERISLSYGPGPTAQTPVLQRLILFCVVSLPDAETFLHPSSGNHHVGCETRRRRWGVLGWLRMLLSTAYRTHSKGLSPTSIRNWPCYQVFPVCGWFILRAFHVLWDSSLLDLRRKRTASLLSLMKTIWARHAYICCRSRHWTAPLALRKPVCGRERLYGDP